MLYRRNEKGRFEAVTDNGEVITFEDKHEMAEFIEAREELHYLVGREPENSEFEMSSSPTACGPTSTILGKTKKIRIHKGVYTVENGKLIKEKTA